MTIAREKAEGTWRRRILVSVRYVDVAEQREEESWDVATSRRGGDVEGVQDAVEPCFGSLSFPCEQRWFERVESVIP